MDNYREKRLTHLNKMDSDKVPKLVLVTNHKDTEMAMKLEQA